MRNAGDITGLNRIRGMVRSLPHHYNSNSYPSPYSRHTPTSSASPSFSSPTAHKSYNMSSNSTFGSSMGINLAREPVSDWEAGRITFKTSPFYTITRPLTPNYECKGEFYLTLAFGSMWLTQIVRESTRDTTRLTVNLSQDVIDTLNNDPSCRIMVFCAPEPIGPYARDASDIAFPHNKELKCDGDEFKANLRGLNNRPGSTRPADITAMIRPKPANYLNYVEMV